MVSEGRDIAAVRRVLESLPDWFGDPTGIDYYATAADDPGTLSVLAFDNDEVIGVALVRRPFPETAELHLIAVTPDRHRAGIGSALLDHIVASLITDGCLFLTVHTVGPSYDSAHYTRTRAFYQAHGFHPLEERTGLDWWGPTLILVRPLLSEAGVHRQQSQH